VKQWISERKMTTRIEDSTPSEWFTTRWKEWQKTLQQFKTKQTGYRSALKNKDQIKAQKAKTKEARKKAKEAAAKKKEVDLKKKREEAERKLEEETKKMEEALAKGEEYVPAEIELPEEEEIEPEVEEEEPEEVEETPIDFEALDVFGVEDVLNVGAGEPLFSNFNFEDWTLLALRYEIHLLAHAFRKDVDDEDRPGMVLEHFAFYYQKYFKKAFNLKFFGLETAREVMDLIKDTVLITGKNGVIDPRLPNELESYNVFVMITEESRRNRVMRIAAGDDSAKLKIVQAGGMQLGAGAAKPAAGGLRPGGAAQGAKPPLEMPPAGGMPGLQQPQIRPVGGARPGGAMLMPGGGAMLSPGGGAIAGKGGGKGGGNNPNCKWCRMGECWNQSCGVKR